MAWSKPNSLKQLRMKRTSWKELADRFRDERGIIRKEAARDATYHKDELVDLNAEKNILKQSLAQAKSDLEKARAERVSWKESADHCRDTRNAVKKRPTKISLAKKTNLRT